MKDMCKRVSLSNIILWTLTVIALGTAVLYARETNKMSDAYADIMQVESISSTTQRQINLASTDVPQQREVFVISDSTVKALSIDGGETISLLKDPAIAVLAHEVLEQWFVIEEILSVNWKLEDGQETQELNLMYLGLARDAHFKAMTDLSNGISDYTQVQKAKINQYQYMLLVLCFLIAMILFNKGMQTRAELQISKELAQKAQIDTATGLYNRSRCQELFKANQSNQKNPAIIVFDLNDLKKTNDNLGHRVGDELIFTFASLLKTASNVHTVLPFIGRYGGDEFIVYYDDIQEETELEVYLKELDFLRKERNEKESRFQVSYAAGYACISSNSAEKMTVRQLFDHADAAMYENKVAGKRALNPNYDQEKASGIVR